MANVCLTKRIEFSASHRYFNEAWDHAHNRAVFGACSRPSGHGHNYLLEVTVEGDVDEDSGMVVNLSDLKQVLKQVLEEFDHKHLNLDTPYFKTRIPTTENIAGALWRILSTHAKIGRLQKVRLFEDEDLFADVTKESFSEKNQEMIWASVTRRYHFSAAHYLGDHPLPAADRARIFGMCQSPAIHGHNYVLHVTVAGAVNPDTGMVTDLSALDRVVHDHVIRRFDHRNLSEDPDLSKPVTGTNIARFVWQVLMKSIPGGRLERIGLTETDHMTYEYVGAELPHPAADPISSSADGR